MADARKSNGKEVELTDIVTLPPDYKPSLTEQYMNPLHLEYFRRKLEIWKTEILKESAETIHHMQEESHNDSDLADRATTETDRSLELRARDRERKLLNKINEALDRIRDKTYGYCEETGDPIGLARLEARPIATLSLEAQERHEKEEKVYREE
jgi:RNA polymerase-binding transcription factor